ncbi:MAG TPA: ATP-binding protein [Rhizomicrobium sp.]|nr:ATP-binding protein [Rhizomicrobium sp.]
MSRSIPVPSFGRLDALLDLRATRYGLALAFVVLAFGFTLVLQHIENGRAPVFLFSAAVLATAWVGGVGPGLLAATTSVLAVYHFYLERMNTVAATRDDVVLFIFFLVCAVAGGLLSSRQREIHDALKQEIAERQRTERALADTRATLEHAARLTALGELTASIAHEINQPLAAVITNASCARHYLGEEHLDLEEARDAADSVMQDANRASEVIRRIRAFVRRMPVERGPVAINHLVADAMALVEEKLRRHHVTVQTALADDLPPVLGDTVQLQQVVLNIVLNALEAMTDTPSRAIGLKTERAGGEILLTVADNGAGFDRIAPQAAFDAFVTTKADGLGLGLSICRSIVEAHGGHMTASSRAPHGAVLTVALPIEGDA